MTEQMPGGWSNWNFELTPDAKKVFEKALQGFVGVAYTPLAFATQVVAGENYCFLCKGKVVYPDAPEFPAKVYIYQPLKGDPHITEIKKIKP